MKRSTELTLFTLAVLVLSTIALHGIGKLAVSLDASAHGVAKTYLMSETPENYSFPEIEFSDKTTEELELEGR